MRLVLALLAACAPRPVAAPTKPIDVRITEMPDRSVSCWLPDIPAPPPMKELQFTEDDIIRRVSVHYLEHNALIEWSMGMVSWAEEAKRCLDSLRGIE